MNQVQVSGPATLDVFEYGNKRYLLFGDYHESMKDNCGEKCKDIDLETFEFTNDDQEDSEICYDITRLIDKIISDATKSMRGIDVFLEITGVFGEQPHIKDVKSDIKYSGYLKKMEYIFYNCFYDLEHCRYNNARFHYIDVRSTDFENSFPETIYIHYIRYIKDTIFEYLDNRESRITIGFDFFVEMTNIIIKYVYDTVNEQNKYIHYLIFEIILTSRDPKKEIDILLEPLKDDLELTYQKYNLIETDKFDKKRMYLDYDKLMTDLNEIHLVLTKHEPFIHKIRRQLDALIMEKNGALADKIVDFVLKKFKNYNLESYIMKKWNIFLIEYKKLVNKVGFDLFISDDIKKDVHKVITPLVDIDEWEYKHGPHALWMDTYALARIFRQYSIPYNPENIAFKNIDFDTVIIFAGNAHIQIYIEFFNYLSNYNLTIHRGQPEKLRCLKIDSNSLFGIK